MRNFVLTEVENEIGYDLDDATYADWENRSVIIASQIRNLDDVMTIANIVENPDAFENQTVTVTGTVGSPIGERSFEFYQDQAIGTAGTVLVWVNDGDMLDFGMEGQQVTVTGTVRYFVRQAFESEFGVDVPDDAYTDWENRPVIVAERIDPQQ